MTASGMADSAWVVGLSNPVLADSDLDGYPLARRLRGAARGTTRRSRSANASWQHQRPRQAPVSVLPRGRRAEAAKPPSTAAPPVQKVRNTRLGPVPISAATPSMSSLIPQPLLPQGEGEITSSGSALRPPSPLGRRD